jgi:serine/threonine protein kinase/WD40 repeat protein
VKLFRGQLREIAALFALKARTERVLAEVTMSERDLFIAALKISEPAERSAWLDRECGGDAVLRQRIDVLLQAFDKAGSLLENPVVDVGPTVDQPARDGPGSVIGPYKLLEQIGEGGFGVVYMAEQTKPVRRKVALKVLKPGMDTRQVVARFEAERQALALMDHPNIARVFDGGETTAGRPYFVMELVRGVPITDFCDINHMPVRQRLELFATVCHAVQHAHHKGVIHRDLKPSNIMVTLHDGAPVVKVIDFGIAKALGQQLTDKTLFTNFAQMIGTPIYMSPEQAEMSGLDIDTRSDIYSLGVLLYELLTGTTPCDRERLKTAGFDEIRRIIREDEPATPSTRITALGASATLVSANRQSDPRRLSQLVRGDLDWIVMKALEKDRQRRYETASALAADVLRHLRDEPVLACPPSTMDRLRRVVRRHKTAVVAGTALLLTLVIGMIGTTWGMIRATVSEARAIDEANKKDDALADSKEQLFQALWHRARAGRFSRQPGQRLDCLDALAKAARIRPAPQLRHEAIAALALPDVRFSMSFQPWNADTRYLIFDRYYHHCCKLDLQGVITVHDIPAGRLMGRFPSVPRPRGTTEWGAFSPDGELVAKVEGQGNLRVWRVRDGSAVLDSPPASCGSVTFSRDSRTLAADVDGFLVLFDMATGRETRRWRLPARVHSLAFAPDGRRLAAGYITSAVASVYDLADGSLVAELPGERAETVVTWHPDGNRLAVSADNRIQIWVLARKVRLATLEGHFQQVTALSFHPEGELLASVSMDGKVLLWHASSGRPLLQVPPLVSFGFSGDGRWLGTTWRGDSTEMLEVNPGREYRTLISNLGAARGTYHRGAISPDGRLLAVGMADGARLWDLRTGRELARLPTGYTVSVAFRPNGELLTAGWEGLYRWPARAGSGSRDELQFGPARLVALPFIPQFLSLSPDGRTLAVVGERSGVGQILDLDQGSVRVGPIQHSLVSYAAYSPDGRWLATSGWHSDRILLWNVATGKMAREWNTQEVVIPFFTPDSRSLVTSVGSDFLFRDVQTDQLTRRLRRDGTAYPGWVAFSPDGGLMAAEVTAGVIDLRDVATGKTVARLEDPHGDRAPAWLGFTPDGTRLVAVYTASQLVHVWDLRMIRARLKEIGLDWEWDEFPAEDETAATAPPLTVKVVSGADVLTREQKARQAIEHYRAAVAAKADDPDACNSLAWAYLTAPDPLRDAKIAVPLAEKAVRLAPTDAHYRNTLGVAYYRASRYRDAVDALRPNLDRQDDKGLAFDLYFLAMSYQQLGETVRARDYYDWAVRWVGAQRDLPPGQQEELTLFRAEAAELLRMEPKKD